MRSTQSVTGSVLRSVKRLLDRGPRAMRARQWIVNQAHRDSTPARECSAPPALGVALESAMRELGQRTVQGRPNTGYFARRFIDFELASLNTKALGYELARMLSQKNLSRTVSQPVSVTLSSKLCTQKDMESDWYLFWASELRLLSIYHRKYWEICYIAQVLWSRGMLKPGMRGLGFGCGQEPLPSLFAKYGASVLATDLAADSIEAQGWAATGQHAKTKEALRLPYICADLALLENIDFRPVNMNDIPADLAGGFDFCWSSCALEHLGSIDKGLRFLEESLSTLRPGGVSVHTMEYNLSDGETLDNWPTVLFQKKHLAELAGKLQECGHDVAQLDFSVGQDFLDNFFDIPPFPYQETIADLGTPVAHLRVSIDGFPATSFGLAIRKRERPG